MNINFKELIDENKLMKIKYEENQDRYIFYGNPEGANNISSTKGLKPLIERLSLYVNNEYKVPNVNEYVGYYLDEFVPDIDVPKYGLLTKTIVKDASLSNINDNCNAEERFGLVKRAREMNKRIVRRMTETGGRYANIRSPESGFTNHHLLPYSICINKRNNAETFEEFDYWEDLACSNQNVISLPYPVHKELHRRLESHGFYCNKYIPDNKFEELKQLTINLVISMGYEEQVRHLL